MQINIGRIDLTTGKVTYEAIPEEWKSKYIGARGLGVKYVFENGPKVDPLSPDNILCFMNGPLTGTEANMSGRMAVVTKSPLTGTVTDSHHGGWSAARLRWAGFDGLIFKGKAAKPVYAYVHDGKVELLDASEVWGKGVHDTVKYLQGEVWREGSDRHRHRPGRRESGQVCLLDQRERSRQRARRHRLRGRQQEPEGHRDQGREEDGQGRRSREAWKAAHQNGAGRASWTSAYVTTPRKGGLSVYGTNVLMNMTNNIGALPTKNSQLTSFGEDAEKISGEYVKQNILVDDPTCHACPVACKKEVEIKEGPWKGLHMESVEYEPAWSVGANCGNNDVNTVAKMIDLCNDYGMDAIEIGHPLSI